MMSDVVMNIRYYDVCDYATDNDDWDNKNYADNVEDAKDNDDANEDANDANDDANDANDANANACVMAWQ